MSQPMTINSSLLSAAHTGKEESIHDFLAKPFPLLSGVFQASDTSSTFVRPLAFYDILSQEPYASKLKGFMGFRGDMVLRLVVNANRFQAGRYILGLCPYGGTGNAKADAISYGSRFANLTTITQLPHVEIDLSTQTTATFEFPYNCLYSHVPVNATDYSTTHSIGRIFIVPYVPLIATAGSTTAPFDLFVSFKNVDLAAPCYPQSGKFRAKTNTESEQKAAGVGPVSGIAKGVGVLANTIGDLVPTLTSLTAPVSWACDIIAGVAKVFGWSNPVNLEHSQRVTETKLAYATNCDNIDNSLPLSLYSSNQVEVVPGFAGNDIDEMAIDYIKSKPAFIYKGAWPTSAAADTSLWSTDVDPSIFYTTFASGSNTVICHTPVSFLSQFFQLYRGGMRFTFKLVKTEFHSGRLLLSFNPNAFSGAGVSTTNAQSVYTHRQIIDVREGLTFDFIVPYVALAPYKNLNGNYTNIGRLDLRVLNPLVAPSTVSATISFIIEAAGAPDLEFAVPATHNMQQTIVYNPQSASFVPKKDADSIVTSIIGNATLIHDQHYSARACIGEKVVSMLSFLKKDDQFPTTFPSQQFIVFDPHSVPIWKTTATAVTRSDIVNDNLSLLSSCYLYNRGGVRVRVVDFQSEIGGYIGDIKYLPQTSSSTQYTGVLGNTTTTANPHGLQTYHDANNMEVQIPQYHRFHSRVGIDAVYNAGVPYSINYSVPTTSCSQIEVNTRSGFTQTFSRQASDDFQCGFFLGVPPVLDTSTAV
jgi:hypothetical protein